MPERIKSQFLDIIWEKNEQTIYFFYPLIQAVFILHWDFMQEEEYHGVSGHIMAV